MELTKAMLRFATALFCGATIGLIPTAQAEQPINTIDVAAIDWCPAICPEKEQPGLIKEIVAEVFRRESIRLKLHYMPWARAVKQTTSGKMDALLAPVKAEAPALLYPKYEVGQQATCFYVPFGDTWTYENESSFSKSRHILMVRGNSLEELDNFARANPNMFTYLDFDNYLTNATGMLILGKANTFIYTKNATDYHLANRGLANAFHNAGCVDTANLYMGFLPNVVEKANLLINIFDNRMQDLRQSDFIAEVMQRYGLSDWR